MGFCAAPSISTQTSPPGRGWRSARAEGSAHLSRRAGQGVMIPPRGRTQALFCSAMGKARRGGTRAATHPGRQPCHPIFMCYLAVLGKDSTACRNYSASLPFFHPQCLSQAREWLRFVPCTMGAALHTPQLAWEHAKWPPRLSWPHQPPQLPLLAHGTAAPSMEACRRKQRHAARASPPAPSLEGAASA